MTTGERPGPAPRVLIVWDEQWPRALLRAELREAGYDAVGARNVFEGLAVPAEVPNRGPVRLLVLDEAVARAAGPDLLGRLRRRHGEPPVLFIARGVVEPPAGPWARVLRRPVSVGRVARAVRDLLPLPPASA